MSHNTLGAAELEALDTSIQAHADAKAVVAALDAVGRRQAPRLPPHAVAFKDIGHELDRIEAGGGGGPAGVGAGVPAAAAPGDNEQQPAPAAANPGESL